MEQGLSYQLPNATNPERQNRVSQERVLTHRLTAEFAKLATFLSTKQLKQSTVYQALQPQIDDVVNGYEYGCFSDEAVDKDKSFYRAILWHLEHGANFEGILETLRNRALVSRADIYFFPGVDIGTHRSQNVNVIRDLAIELGYNYYFATSFLHLDWAHAKDNQNLALEGNAIMTRLPLSNLRVVKLPNDRDPMRGTYKRIGCDKAILADVGVGSGQMTLVCVNLPGLSSQRQRSRHMQKVMQYIHNHCPAKPVLLGGDIKTSTYNCRSAAHFFLSVFNKVFRGFDYIVEEHHIFPERHFERRLFQSLRKYDFIFEPFNELGVGSYHCKTQELMGPALSDGLMQKVIKKMLSLRDESVPFKYDWFLANSKVRVSRRHEAERPKVIRHLFKDGVPISSHDPVMLDFEVAAEMTGDVAAHELQPTALNDNQTAKAP
ncbi:MAG: endonuclease/exonuclease/phosphatase [uncultured bacterium]|nr:MAG: endonuclease/exonuclease/phosphatase [uncultured bacterium]